MIFSPKTFLQNSKRLISFTLTLAQLIFIQSVFAADQGQLGTNSNASVDITLTLGLLTRVTGLNDFAFGSWSGGDLSANDNLCIGVYGTTQYRVSATGDGDGSDINAFALTNGADFLPYRVFFNDQTGTAGQIELSSTSALLGQSATGSFFNLFGCFNENANIDLLIENNSLAAAGGGAYSGTLTLTMIPE